LLFASAHARQSQARHITFFTQKQGLSSYNINKIIKDCNNFIWVATQNGLNRFDGREFVIYNKDLEAKRAILSNDVTSLIYDSAKNIIWAICNNGGINGINTITGSVEYAVRYNNAELKEDWRACATFLQGKIYIGTSAGVDIFNTATRSFEKLDNSLFSFYQLTGKNAVRAISIDHNNNIWCAVMGKGIVIFNPAKRQALKKIPFSQFMHQTGKDFFWPRYSVFSSNNNYWLATRAGLFRMAYDSAYNIINGGLENTPLNAFKGQEIDNLFANTDGELIIPGNTLYKYSCQTKTMSQISPLNATANAWLENATFCFEDNEKNIWFGCRQGLGFINHKPPAFLPTANSSFYNYKLSHLYGVCAVNDTDVLSGTVEGLFLVTRNRKIKQLLAKRLVQNIFRFKDGDIIISGNKSLCIYTNGVIVPIEQKYPEFSQYKTWQFNSRVYINSSTMVIGTENYQGVLVWDFKSHYIINLRQPGDKGQSKASAIASNIINTVFFTKNKQVAILSDYSLTLLNPYTLETRPVRLKYNGEVLNILMDMAETKNNYWVTVYGFGLAKLDKNFNLLKVFKVNDGLSSTSLYKIFNYNDSLLVLTSDFGVSIFNTGAERFLRYFDDDGLQDNTFEEACGDTLNNNIYTGGDNGFVKINPAGITAENHVPELYFTRLLVERANDTRLDTGNLNASKFIIPNDALQSNIYFTGLHYTNAGRVYYEYKIKQIKDEWLKLNTQNFITLVGMQPGTYTLQVKAANEDGVWSPVKELQLVFLPKWYQTWLFKLAIIAVVAGLLYALYRYRIEQILRVDRLRRKLSSDLHDDIGSTLNSVNLFTKMAMMQQNQGEYLPRIKEGVQNAITSVRDIIWIMDKEPETIESIFSRINAFSQPVSAVAGSALQTNIDPAIISYKLHGQEKQNVYLVIKEAINNCIKYAGCKKITLQAKKINKQIVVSIADDGKGIDKEDGAVKITTGGSGNGLKNMQLRCGEIKWKFTLDSAPGKGTCITITGKIKE